MVFDDLLGLPHVDWAGIESAPATRTNAANKAARRPAKKSAPRRTARKRH
jgi:beta-lactamase class C